MEARVKLRVIQELNRLNELLQATQKSLAVRMVEYEKITKLTNELLRLKKDMRQKEAYFENIKVSLRNQDFEAGASELANQRLFSRAVPVMKPVTPDVERVFGLTLIASLILSALFVILHQVYARKIYDINDLHNLFGNKNNIKIKVRDLIGENIFDKRSKTKFDQTHVFSKQIKSGGFGCLIQVGDIGKNKVNLIRTTSFLLSNFFSDSQKALICATISENNLRDNTLFVETSNFAVIKASDISTVENGKKYLTNLNSNDLNYLNKEANMNILKKRTDFLFSIDQHCSHSNIDNILEMCDYAILVGRSGYLSVSDLEKLTAFYEEVDKKCNGFILLT